MSTSHTRPAHSGLSLRVYSLSVLSSPAVHWSMYLDPGTKSLLSTGHRRSLRHHTTATATTYYCHYWLSFFDLNVVWSRVLLLLTCARLCVQQQLGSLGSISVRQSQSVSSSLLAAVPPLLSRSIIDSCRWSQKYSESTEIVERPSQPPPPALPIAVIIEAVGDVAAASASISVQCITAHLHILGSRPSLAAAAAAVVVSSAVYKNLVQADGWHWTRI